MGWGVGVSCQFSTPATLLRQRSPQQQKGGSPGRHQSRYESGGRLKNTYPYRKSKTGRQARSLVSVLIKITRHSSKTAE